MAITQYVAASLDDSYCEGNDAAQAPTNTIINTRSGNGVVGDTRSGAARFQLNIPQGATINSCKFYGYTLDAAADSPSLDFYGDDVDNSPEFSGANNIVYGRTRTTATVNWAAADIGIGAYKASPELKTILQEVVDRGSWASGNYFCLLLIGNTAAAVTPCWFYSYDYNSAQFPPYLYVTYDTEVTASVSIGVAVSATRTFAFTRTASVLIGVLVSATRTFAFNYVASVVVGVVATATKSWGIVKSSSVAIGVAVSATKSWGRSYVASVAIGVVVSATETFVEYTGWFFHYVGKGIAKAYAFITGKTGEYAEIEGEGKSYAEVEGLIK